MRRGLRLSRRRRGEEERRGDEERRGEERRRGGEEEQATDIKSNNPHLAGGEIFTIDSPSGGFSIGKIKNHLKQTHVYPHVIPWIFGFLPYLKLCKK